jgi:hypothetical protein
MTGDTFAWKARETNIRESEPTQKNQSSDTRLKLKAIEKLDWNIKEVTFFEESI